MSRIRPLSDIPHDIDTIMTDLSYNFGLIDFEPESISLNKLGNSFIFTNHDRLNWESPINIYPVKKSNSTKFEMRVYELNSMLVKKERRYRIMKECPLGLMILEV